MLLAEAVARLLVSEGQDVAADRDVVVVVEHPVCAPADHLGRAGVAELFDQSRQQLREPPPVRGRVEADRVDIVGRELVDALVDQIADLADLAMVLPAGSGMSQSSTLVGT